MLNEKISPPGRKKSKKSSAREPVGGLDYPNIYQKMKGVGANGRIHRKKYKRFRKSVTF